MVGQPFKTFRREPSMYERRQPTCSSSLPAVPKHKEDNTTIAVEVGGEQN